MTLQRLREKQPDVVDADMLEQNAIWMVERESYSDSDRLSALHVLSSVNQEKADGFARSWLCREDVPLQLQTTAIAVLGQQDLTPADRELVRSCLTHPELRLRYAARNALAHKQKVRSER